jgi:hypothetical protein
MLAQNSSLEDLTDFDSTHSDADACFAIEGAGNAGDHADGLEPKLASVLNTVGPPLEAVGAGRGRMGQQSSQHAMTYSMISPL